MKDRMFFDTDDSKMYIRFEVQAHGRTHTFQCNYDDDVQWGEVLDEVVAVLESSYGYSFDMEGLGIHYLGKKHG